MFKKDSYESRIWKNKDVRVILSKNEIYKDYTVSFLNKLFEKHVQIFKNGEELICSIEIHKMSPDYFEKRKEVQ